LVKVRVFLFFRFSISYIFSPFITTLLYLSVYSQFKPSKRSLVTAIAVGLLLALLAVFSWVDHIKSGQRNFNQQIQAKANSQVSQIESNIKNDIDHLRNLTARIEHTKGDYFEFWSWDAQRLIRQNPSVQFVEWIDSNMVIRMVEPEKGNEQAIGFNISQVPQRSSEWKKNIASERLNISNYIDLKQGGRAFLVDNPMYFDDMFRGTLTMGLYFNESFHSLLSTKGWQVIIKDETGEAFFENRINEELAAPEYTFTKVINLPEQNKSWTYQLRPSRAIYNAEVVYKDLIGFVLSLILSVLVAVLIYIDRMRARQKYRLQATNRELQELNSRLEEERERAQKASNSKTEFMSNMSHEIRTPLNALLGLIGLMKSKEKGAENKRFLEMMEFSSSALLSLVNDILDLDKIESGHLSLKNESFSAKDKMLRLHELFKPGFAEKDLHLRLETHGDEYRVKGDPDKFTQIGVNLVRNAYKFTETGEVVIRLDQEKVGENLQITLSVTDTGIGIPEEKKLHIFERFTQVDSSRSRQHEGTGLGLAITHKLVKAMNGEIFVKSEVGEGSEFTVKLSLSISEEAHNSGSSDEGLCEIYFSDSRVLIVEDNQINVMVLKSVLKQFGIEADVAGNGKEALNAVSENDYQLIFMDVHMPVMDGFEATRKLREMGCKIPIVALSANVTAEASAEAKALGMQRYLTKPFSRQRLHQILTEFLSTQKV